MASTEGMETYAARLASFDIAHPGGKKRTSNAKGAKTLKWPHKTPSVAQLAKAGFYYKPTASYPDSTTCFLCRNGLDGWEEDDDPVVEHLKHSPSCGWAIHAAIEKDIENGTFEEENPLSDRMLEARRSTFGDMWPHNNKRGWTCKTQKMIEAGWYYCPTAESDDFVKCAYCNLSLDGWEPKDNPYNEHQRRSPDCAYFILTEAVNEKPVRAKKGRASRVSRVSMQSNMTMVSEDQSVLDARIEEDDSALTNATEATTTSAVAKVSKKTGRPKKGKSKARSKTTKPKAEEATQASSFIEPEDDDFAVKIETFEAKGTKGKKRTSDEIDVDSLLTNTDANGPPAKRRATRTRSSTLKPQPMPEVETSVDPGDHDIHMTDAEDIPPSTLVISKKPKGGRKRASSTVRKASNLSTASKASLRIAVPADDEIDAALEADLNRPLTDDEAHELVEEEKPKTRRLTRTRPGSRNGVVSVAPMRRTTRTSVLSRQGVETDRTVSLVLESERPVNQGRSRRSTSLLGEEAPTAIPTAKAKTKSQARIDKNTSDDVAMADGHETETAAAQTAAQKEEHLDENVEGQQAGVPAEHAVSQTDLKLAKGHRSPVQISSQLRGRNSQASVSPASSAAAQLQADLDSSVLALETAGDETGHETDASTTRKAPVKLGSRKAGRPSKKGKGTKRVAAVSRHVKNVGQISSVGSEAHIVPTARDEEIALDSPMGMVQKAVDAQQEESTLLLDEPAEQEKMETKVSKLPKVDDSKDKMKVQAAADSIPQAAEELHQTEVCGITDNGAQGAATIALDTKSPSPIITPALVSTSPLPSSPKTTVPSPTPSLQSSDAENQPPSSRPSQQRPPLANLTPSKTQTIRIPLAASTPTTSPSKRIATSKLQTTYAWTTVDIENLFLGSPSTDKGNGAVPAFERSADPGIDVLKSPEKKMTVEEWIQHNARQGEEKLRNECERLVGKFEGEGVRALKALEGIICVE